MIKLCIATNGLNHAMREGTNGATDEEGAGIIVACEWPSDGEGRITLDPIHERIVTQAIFQTFSECKELSLSNLNISDIANNTFATMPELRRLTIEGNHIDSVRRAMFNGMASQVLASDFWLKMPNNNILFIERQTFADIKELAVLDLSRNPLSGPVAPETFMVNTVGIPSWHSFFFLDLSYTGVVIDQGLFQYNPNLSSLKISGNQFTPNIWQGLELDFLVIENASFAQLNEAMWEGLESLWGLTLNCSHFHHVETIRAHSFEGLTKLRWLALHNCGIKYVEALAFQGSLVWHFTVNLSYNPIVTVDKNIFGTPDWGKKELVLGREIFCKTEMCWMKTKEYNVRFLDDSNCTNLNKSVSQYFLVDLEFTCI